MRVNKLAISSFIIFYFLITPAYALEEGIEVTGTAKEAVAPDMATFLFSVNGRGKELANLKAEIDKKTAATVAICKNLGVKTKNITSAEISIRPQYNYQTKSFTGYEVSRNIKVILENLDKYSELVNGVIKSGVTTINNIHLDTKDREVLERKALGAAIASARKKAEIIAKSSDAKIGKVIYVKEGGGPIRLESYKFTQRGKEASLAQGAFEPGEISLSATVSVRYSIK